ncbi:MAG: uracil-DNA glycosylase [Puniceicoccales bacterium]|jgi:DNA polymerase|nr:uracil-DNA glycosylase [Puniceicoccales bacterium]
MALPNEKVLELLEMELLALKSEGFYSLPISRNSILSLKNLSSGVDKSDSVLAPMKQSHSGEKESRTGPSVKATALPINPKVILPQGSKLEQYEWLKNRVLNCEECKKHVRPGKKIVFGVGNIDANILFCGEAPGADEETMGEPFVGRAGQLLTKIILAMGLSRSDVYIANIMNWRPEMPTAVGNRPPTQEEMEFCLPYLLAQIEIVQPKVIVALGATAVSGLLGHDPTRRMHDVRGKWAMFANTPLMVTFHPSYLLRNNTNAAKRGVWEDMLEVMKKLHMPISEKQQNYFL